MYGRGEECGGGGVVREDCCFSLSRAQRGISGAIALNQRLVTVAPLILRFARDKFESHPETPPSPDSRRSGRRGGGSWARRAARCRRASLLRSIRSLRAG